MYLGQGKRDYMSIAERGIQFREFENLLAEVFRKAGWKVQRPSSARDAGVDLVFDGNQKKYLVQLKVSSEGRRDRLIPLLSQAVLEARASVQHFREPVTPMAVVAAKHIPGSVAEQIKAFAKRFAPEVEIGVIDAEGLRAFAGDELKGLEAKPARRHDAMDIASGQRPPDLFSDLNQWMLKVLLGQRLPKSLISVPREPIRHASQLAKVANVSVMSASRLLNLLSDRGFLDDQERLELVRVEELLDLWISANRDQAKEIPARWIIKKGPEQLQAAIREYSAPPALSPSRRSPRARDVLKSLPRCCLALFAAADSLGFGFVKGVPSHIYLERLTLDAVNRLGLVVDHSSRPADVYIRIPVNREAIFRASVMREGVPVSDVLQVWLDVSAHPARGREQAREIKRRLLKPLFEKQR